MSKKYHCPHHEESTPSAVAYANSYYSFCCGRGGPLSELGLKPGERIEVTYVEDIAASIERIERLPRQEIRGFSLHADSLGYYIVWPDRAYYKRRILGAESGSKYRGPSGHSKPPFVAQVDGKYSRLILIEGEFNALSLALLEPAATVISPGGAGDFYSKRGSSDLESYSAQYTGSIDIVVDADAAGVQAAIETKAKLITLGCEDVRIFLVEKDLNDILVQDGKEALREQVKRMGLS
jgi:hypothetical protein